MRRLLIGYWVVAFAVSALITIPPLAGVHPVARLGSNVVEMTVAQIGMAYAIPGVIVASALCEPVRPKNEFNPSEQGWDESNNRFLADSKRSKGLFGLVLVVSAIAVCWPVLPLLRRKEHVRWMGKVIGLYTTAHSLVVCASFLLVASQWNAMVD
jgi:hypothetical protein